MKTLVVAFAFASLVAASPAWARTESPVAVRSGVFTSFRADRTVARPAPQSYALMLGVAF
jgi:hypothetical protein